MTTGSVLVTGGAGYIGSHTVLEILKTGREVVVLDNLGNSSAESIKRVQEITKKTCAFHNVSLEDTDAVRKVFKEHPNITSVIHFAGHKAVGESWEKPLEYYWNNVGCALNLMRVMKEHHVFNLVFSSSATVYGEPDDTPIPEECPKDPKSPYGRSKDLVEQMMIDVCKGDSRWAGCVLRYFNPAGAHESGRIGEDPKELNNLMPYLAAILNGDKPKLRVFGTDYATKDGTGIRDYIHVVDLALGHLKALEKLEGLPAGQKDCLIYNLGTGRGSTVLEMVAAMEKATGKKIPYELCPRRAGDVRDLTARPTKGEEALNWKATRSIEQACRDLWRWKSRNPQGFNGPELDVPEDKL